MFNVFQLESTKQTLVGYSWDVKEPKLVVCLVHGLGEYAGRYNRIGEAFKSKDIALLGVDLPGHGCTKGKRGHIGSRKNINVDINNLISYAKEKYKGTNIVLYGHSLGGNIVLNYRLRGGLSKEPVAYLVTSPWIKLSKLVPKPVYGLVKMMSKIKPDFLINGNISDEKLGNMKMVNMETEKVLMHNKISLQTAYEAYAIGEKLLKEDIEEDNHTQLILMHGSADPICSVEGSREYAKHHEYDCTYIEWENYLHELHNGIEQEDGSAVIEKMIQLLIPFEN